MIYKLVSSANRQMEHPICFTISLISMSGIGGNCLFVSSTTAWDEKYVINKFAFS